MSILVNANPANGSFTYPFPPYWKNSRTGKIGVTFRATERATLRGGYLYTTNPVPERTVFVTFPAISSQAVTAGVGFELLGVTLEASPIRALNAAENGTPAQHLLGAEYRGSRTTMQQNVFTLGAVWRY